MVFTADEASITLDFTARQFSPSKYPKICDLSDFKREWEAVGEGENLFTHLFEFATGDHDVNPSNHHQEPVTAQRYTAP